MITGKLIFGVEIAVENEAEMTKLSSKIEKAVVAIDSQKILLCEEVDTDITDDADETPEE